MKVIGVCQGVRSQNGTLLTHQSYFTDICSLKKLNEDSDNSVQFVYNRKVNMPVLPFVKMKLQGYKYKFPED
jgi:hypothetical protein